MFQDLFWKVVITVAVFLGNSRTTRPCVYGFRARRYALCISRSISRRMAPLVHRARRSTSPSSKTAFDGPLAPQLPSSAAGSRPVVISLAPGHRRAEELGEGATDGNCFRIVIADDGMEVRADRPFPGCPAGTSNAGRALPFPGVKKAFNSWGASCSEEG